MFTADQLVAHMVGDYILQSDWMVRQKGCNSFACAIHCLVYAIPFLLLTTNPYTLAIIVVSHFFLDRWRLARYVIWLKNRPWPSSLPWKDCVATGYPPNTPHWLAGWLFIIVDNTLHVLINGVAIYYIG